MFTALQLTLAITLSGVVSGLISARAVIRDNQNKKIIEKDMEILLKENGYEEKDHEENNN